MTSPATWPRSTSQVRLHVTLPPYGGVPGKNLMHVGSGQAGSGEAYLAAIRDHIPADAEVFWTGDRGPSSAKVTLAAASAYADAAGHRVALWDNDALDFARYRWPLSGRSADLVDSVDTYIGNMVGRLSWAADNGEFALSTMLDYTWNPAAYDPDRSAAQAEQQLRQP